MDHHWMIFPTKLGDFLQGFSGVSATNYLGCEPGTWDFDSNQLVNNTYIKLVKL